MGQFFEALEGRTLFSVTVPSDYAVINAALTSVRANDVGLLPGDYRRDATAAIADVSTVAKSKTKTLDIARLHGAVAQAIALEDVDFARFLAVEKLDVARVHAFDVLDAKKPTAANLTRLTNALDALASNPTTAEDKLYTQIGVSNTKVDAAMNAILALDPTNVTLQEQVQNSSGFENTDLASIETQLTTINDDNTTLADDILGVSTTIPIASSSGGTDSLGGSNTFVGGTLMVSGSGAGSSGGTLVIGNGGSVGQFAGGTAINEPVLNLNN